MTIYRNVVPRVFVDAEQMTQVFVNIVLNAVQVSPRGAQVKITALVKDDAVAIDVRDEGPGISPEHLPKIFDPFFSTKKRGTGLGLAISNRIVQSHGGRFEVLQPERGTIVRVLVPLITTAATAEFVSTASPGIPK